ncbi:MAG: hypothetical protein CUN56_09215 [Phototrophicales bacterium]|nr:MAG: hypothetical protein CUN56_09215 [Phototrophicales bacterium]RMG75144.1 MAG: hypothetical protein D6711_07400 [Chloroflexota bacterium]
MKQLIILMLFLLISIPTAAQDQVDLPLPDIPPGQQIVIVYQVTINEDLQPNVTVISNQGVITGSNFSPIYTNDPETTLENDATLTQLGFNLDIEALPTTGQSPWWRLPVMIGAIIGMAMMLWMGIRAIKQQPPPVL